MRLLLSLLTLIINTTASYADCSIVAGDSDCPWRLLELEETSIEYKAANPSSRDPILNPQGYQLAQELNLNVNVTVAKAFFVNSQVHSLSDPSQFRLVGWHWQVGARVSPYFDVFVDHFSQHLLDTAPPSWNYSSTNAVGVKIYLYRSSRKPETTVFP